MPLGCSQLNLRKTTPQQRKASVTAVISTATAILLLGAVLSGAAGHLFVPGVAEAAGQGNLVVNRLSTADGSSLNMWVTVTASGGWDDVLKASWETPWEFTGDAGTEYSVTAHNWKAGKIFFSHWSDGSTERTRKVTLEEGTTTTLTAYYDVEGAQASTAGTTTATATTTAEAPPAAPQQPPVVEQKATPPPPAPPEPAKTSSSNNNSHRDSTGVYVPLYKYPDLGNPSGLWSAVVKAKKEHPSVPFVVSVNPSNGPGGSADSKIKSAIDELKSAGVEHVLGYLPTMYGKEPSGRTLGDLKDMIDDYRAWYPKMDGLMMDTMAAGSDKIWFYKELVSYARDKGFTFIKGNPGAKVDKGYIGLFDNIGIYENHGAPSISQLASNTYHPAFGKENFAFTAKSVPSLDKGYVEQLKDYVAYVYMTNDGDGNPYNSVPPYFFSMVEALDD
jgi:hypothetical protein